MISSLSYFGLVSGCYILYLILGVGGDCLQFLLDGVVRVEIDGLGEFGDGGSGQFF